MTHRLFLGLIMCAALSSGCAATPMAPTDTAARSTDSVSEEPEYLLDLSRQKWLWMAERNTIELEALFHPKARFVHMGATMDRQTELNVIREGQIEYVRADISEISVEMLGETAIVYSRLRLLAVVGGNEVSNPFSVTEVYVLVDGRWQLASMAFTRLLGD